MGETGKRLAFTGDSGFWDDDAVTNRLRDVTLSPETIRRIDDFIGTGSLSHMDMFKFGQALRKEGASELEHAVRDDVMRRFDGLGDAPSGLVGTERATSFRFGGVSLMDMIAADYDGTADGKNGNPEAVRSLAHELYVMAVECYANIPSLYYPRETDGEFWIIRNVSSPIKTGPLRIPLEAVGVSAEELIKELPSRTSIMIDAWWGEMLRDRAEVVRLGCIFPLRTEFTASLVERYRQVLPQGIPLDEFGTGGGNYRGTDAGLISCCAEAIRYYMQIEDDLDGMVETDDVPALCDVVDGMMDRAWDPSRILIGLGQP